MNTPGIEGRNDGPQMAWLSVVEWSLRSPLRFSLLENDRSCESTMKSSRAKRKPSPRQMADGSADDDLDGSLGPRSATSLDDRGDRVAGNYSSDLCGAQLTGLAALATSVHRRLNASAVLPFRRDFPLMQHESAECEGTSRARTMCETRSTAPRSAPRRSRLFFNRRQRRESATSIQRARSC
jgi:hypothetical protein